MMRLGLDFGTTNSTIALFDGETLQPLTADPHNENPFVLPSLIYIDRKAHTTIGTRAAERYLEEETGRPVRWARRDAGEFEVTVASLEGDQIDFIQTTSVMVDTAARGRLVQSIKTGLFNVRYSGTRVFGRYYALDDLIAIILRELKTAAERTLSQSCNAVVMGRPVRFADNPAADSRAEAILYRAAHMAGFTDVVFQLEPVGVTYLHHRNSSERHLALVFDFGGGTLDLTVAHVGGSKPPEILATQGVLVGGDDLDRAIMLSLLPHFGAYTDGILPPEMTDRLRTWQTMPELSQPVHLERIRRLQRTVSDSQPLMALETLITRNLGYQLFKQIETLKKQLSSADSAVLRFAYDAIDIEQTITRRRFERLISDHLDDVAQNIEQVIAAAGIQKSDVDVVLRTGGSSLVPAFAQLLIDLFGAEKQRPIEPLTSVVGGFAVSAYEYRAPPMLDPVAIIRDVRSNSGAAYGLHHIGMEVTCYTDRAFAVQRIPRQLSGLPALRMVNTDATATDAAFLRFTLTRPARVYIAYESTAQHLPDWLGAFEPANMQVEVLDAFALIARIMRVYGRDFPAGEVVLGGNMAKGYVGDVILNYLVIVAPV